MWLQLGQCAKGVVEAGRVWRPAWAERRPGWDGGCRGVPRVPVPRGSVGQERREQVGMGEGARVTGSQAIGTEDNLHSGFSCSVRRGLQGTADLLRTHGVVAGP